MVQKLNREFSTAEKHREMQKTTLRFHLIPTRMAKTQVTADAGKDVEKEGCTSIAGGIADWYNHSGNQSGSSSENWK